MTSMIMVRKTDLVLVMTMWGYPRVILFGAPRLKLVVEAHELPLLGSQ